MSQDQFYSGATNKPTLREQLQRDKKPNPKFEIGSIIRYGNGPTALMRIESISNKRYYGVQYFGGSVGALEMDCRPPTPDDLAKWHQRPISGIDETDNGYVEEPSEKTVPSAMKFRLVQRVIDGEDQYAIEHLVTCMTREYFSLFPKTKVVERWIAYYPQIYTFSLDDKARALEVLSKLRRGTVVVKEGKSDG